MKIRLFDIFKRLNIDENGKIDIDDNEVNDTLNNNDDASKTTLDVYSNKKSEDSDKEVADVPDNNVDKGGVNKVSVKYDVNTGLFSGFKDMQDEELRAVLKLANDTVKANKTKATIESAVNKKFGQYKVNDGITTDIVKKLLDLSNVKVDDDGNVTGVDEAFKSLRDSNSGLFKSDNDNKSTAPQLEGYSKANNDVTPMSEEDIINLAYGN